MNAEIHRAVVIGASVAGLASAAALSSRVREVVVLERHVMDGANSQPASIAPQGEFAHVLLGGGAAALDRLLPGFTEELIGRGAVYRDPTDFRTHWWAAGALRRTIPDLGVTIPLCSRALVETVLRSRVTRIPNVEILDDTIVRGLDIGDGNVRSVEVETRGDRGRIDADLVVDASGRGSRAPAWLEAAGFAPPSISRVEIGITYCGVDVARHGSDLDGATFAIVQNSPVLARIGVALPAEGDRWKLVLGGYFGDAAATSRDGLLTFAASLPDPAMSQLLENQWLSDPAHFRFPSSHRRHWEKVSRLPGGFCVIGDGVASFNPIYGQGMSSAVLQAEALGSCVDRHGTSRRLSKAVATATAKVVANPWKIAAGADFVYPQTVGQKAPGTDFVNRYLDKVFVAASTDASVNLALSRVQHLLAPPASLFAPGIVRRVRAAARRSAVTSSAGVRASNLDDAHVVSPG